MPLAQYNPVDREAIWAALFVWLQSQLGELFRSMSRKHVAPPQLQSVDQPALFQVAVREKHLPNKSPGLPVRVPLSGVLILYLFDDSPIEDIGREAVLAETQLNNMLKAIDAAFTPDDLSAGKFTLGGLVTHCWIEGESDLDPGIFGPQAAAIIPVHILP